MNSNTSTDKPRAACRICKLIRIHVFLVVGILAAWRFNPGWFDWLSDTDRYAVPIAIVGALTILFLVKLWQHFSSERRR